MKHSTRSYPSGLGGVGLLLLRGSAASLLLALAIGHSPRSDVAATFLGIAASALLLGICSRSVGFLTALFSVAMLTGIAPATDLVKIAAVLATSSVVLMGPGAFSVDAVRLERRTIRVNDARP